MKDIHAVFWDFDGVVLDSVDVKTKAFARMFHTYGPKIEEAVVQYHLANGGVSRFEKFKYYYKDLLGIGISEEELIALGNKFSNYALEGVMSSAFIPGAIETLQKMQNLRVPAYVVSGTPVDEMCFIVKKLKLSKYFKEVHGSPRSKTEILTEILKRNQYKPQNCIFLGDAMTDYEAAQNVNVKFIGIVRECEHSCFPIGTRVMQIIDIFN